MNCGHACYFNAVVHCLFHCEAARRCLWAAAPLNDVRVEMQALLRAYTEGVQPAGQQSPRHWDVLVPHKLLEVVEEYARSLSAVRRFDFGPQHDAAELLSLLLEATGMGSSCFSACSPSATHPELPRRDEDVLLLVDEVDSRTDLGRITEADVVDMKAFLTAAFDADDVRLRAAPPVLAARLPQYTTAVADAGDEDSAPSRTWIQHDDRGHAAWRPARWGDGVIDLREVAAADCADRSQAVYRVRAFVCYCSKSRVPSRVVGSSGHFTAYFRESDVWYFADDLDPGARVRPMASPPDVYPYVCFLERIGDPAVERSSLPPHAVQGPPALADDAEESEEAASTSSKDESNHMVESLVIVFLRCLISKPRGSVTIVCVSHD